MKVVVTESQIKEVVREEVGANNLLAALSNYVNNPTMVYNALLQALTAGTITMPTVPIILTRLFSNQQNGGEQQKVGILQRLRNAFTNKNNQEQGNKPMEDPNFQEKVQAVNEYMAIAAKNQNFNPANIQISAEAMVNACNQTEFDLPLLMAQAHLESCFGLTSRARRTNSVFSVGSYDNGKNVVTYQTQNDSIMPYIELMQKNYLGQRGVDDILKPGAFVNGANKRYASDKNYENKVASIRNKIIKNYPILAS